MRASQFIPEGRVKELVYDLKDKDMSDADFEKKYSKTRAEVCAMMRNNSDNSLTESQMFENLKKWFSQKWVRFGPDGKIKGDCARGSSKEGKPKCLPAAKAHALGKKGRASAGARKRRQDPDAGRSGKAINVATKKKSNEAVSAAELDEACWKGYRKDGMKTMFGKRYPNCVKVKKQSEDVAEGSVDHRSLGKHHEEMTDQELRKVGSKLPDSWDAAVLRRKLASHPKYAQALKHYDKSEYHFGKAAKQGVAEVSRATIDRYVTKASDAHGAADFAARMSKNDLDKRRYHVDQKNTAEKRRQGISRAMDRMSKDGVAETEQQLAEKCWDTHRQAGMKNKGGRQVPNCVPKESAEQAAQTCSECGGPAFSDLILAEKKDACYNKVRSRYKVWPSAYASGALVQCRKKGAANWGNKSEGVAEGLSKRDQQDVAAIRAAIARLQSQLKQPNADRDAIQQSIAHEQKRLALYKQGVAEAGNKPLEKSRLGTGDTRTPRDIKSQMQGASDEFVKSTADSKTGPFHSKVAKMQSKLAKSELRRREQGVAEGEEGFSIEDMVMDQYRNGNEVWEIASNMGMDESEVQDIIDDNEQGVAESEKVGSMDADAFDDAMARLKQLAGAGPMKTVYDPDRRVYRNVPTAQQPAQQPKK